MKVKLRNITPIKNIDLKTIDFSSWEPFTGITDEQEEFQRKTYTAFVTTRKIEKQVYISVN
jgi:hypothetical protein